MNWAVFFFWWFCFFKRIGFGDGKVVSCGALSSVIYIDSWFNFTKV